MGSATLQTPQEPSLLLPPLGLLSRWLCSCPHRDRRGAGGQCGGRGGTRGAADRDGPSLRCGGGLQQGAGQTVLRVRVAESPSTPMYPAADRDGPSLRCGGGLQQGAGQTVLRVRVAESPRCALLHSTPPTRVAWSAYGASLPRAPEAMARCCAVNRLHKPDDQTVMPWAEGAGFLAPLPPRALPGVGQRGEALLTALVRNPKPVHVFPLHIVISTLVSQGGGVAPRASPPSPRCACCRRKRSPARSVRIGKRASSNCIRAVRKLCVLPAGALPVPVSDGYMGPNRQNFSAKAGFAAGRSRFTAVPGQQHNCLPFTLNCAGV
jgi:hypothetical protein